MISWDGLLKYNFLIVLTGKVKGIKISMVLQAIELKQWKLCHDYVEVKSFKYHQSYGY